MIPSYQQALNGTLVSQTGGAALSSFTLTNNLAVPVNAYTLGADGAAEMWYLTANLGPLTSGVSYSQPDWLPPITAGTWFMVTTLGTGSFVCAFEAQTDIATYVVSAVDMPPEPATAVFLPTNPNNIGPFPEPAKFGPVIPPDSPRVLVGCGALPNGNLVQREQYWERMPDSYCLSPGEQKEFSTTVSEGSLATSSSQTDVTASLDLGASAGWGPVSASISSSLNTQTSTFQQVTVTSRSTSFVSDTVSNTGPTTLLYLRWQLADVITVFANTPNPLPNVTPVASVILGENPELTGGPYELDYGAWNDEADVGASLGRLETPAEHRRRRVPLPVAAERPQLRRTRTPA